MACKSLLTTLSRGSPLTLPCYRDDTNSLQFSANIESSCGTMMTAANKVFQHHDHHDAAAINLTTSTSCPDLLMVQFSSRWHHLQKGIEPQPTESLMVVVISYEQIVTEYATPIPISQC